jgi:hypothetical protein
MLAAGAGLQQVTLRVFKAPALKFGKLNAALASIPAGWPDASYNEYNFITDAESPTASEIAVYGKKPGGALAGYNILMTAAGFHGGRPRRQEFRVKRRAAGVVCRRALTPKRKCRLVGL